MRHFSSFQSLWWICSVRLSATEQYVHVLCVLFPWVNLARSSVSVQRQPSVIIDLHMKKDYQKTDSLFWYLSSLVSWYSFYNKNHINVHIVVRKTYPNNKRIKFVCEIGQLFHWMSFLKQVHLHKEIFQTHFWCGTQKETFNRMSKLLFSMQWKWILSLYGKNLLLYSCLERNEGE